MDKMLQVIQRILEVSPEGRTRKDLAKLLYYSDGIYFQRHGKMITDETYIHLEDRPEPVQLNQAILKLMQAEKIGIGLVPVVDYHFEFTLKWYTPGESKLSKEELRMINKITRRFPGLIQDENTAYPNLYENYVITPLYGEIEFSEKRINTKIHFHKKKSLLTLSGKLFRVIFDS